MIAICHAAELARQRETVTECAQLIDRQLAAHLAVVAHFERNAHEIGMAAGGDEQATSARATRVSVRAALRAQRGRGERIGKRTLAIAARAREQHRVMNATAAKGVGKPLPGRREPRTQHHAGFLRESTNASIAAPVAARTSAIGRAASMMRKRPGSAAARER